MVIDYDGIGQNGIIAELEHGNFGNDCIHPKVKHIEGREIGTWHDDHPLNIGGTCEEEYRRLFAEPPSEEFEPPMCGRCYAQGVELFPAPCTEKPEELMGQPLGMYHCPDCGAMVIAGLPHPELCALCRNSRHPDYDRMEEI
jgi:hypothetical protein